VAATGGFVFSKAGQYGKLTEYRKRGILQGKNLITTYETRAHPLSAQNVRRIIKAFLLPDGNQVA
jgi:hypothetical protein